MKVSERSNSETTLSAKALGFHVVQEKPETRECGRGRRANGLWVVPAFLHLSRDAPKPRAAAPEGPAGRQDPRRGIFLPRVQEERIGIGFIAVGEEGGRGRGGAASPQMKTCWPGGEALEERQGRSDVDGGNAASKS